MDPVNESVLEFMANRRSVPAKTMGAPGPADAEVRRMAQIAMRVPDHGKIAPWRFIIYSDAAKARLGERILEIALRRDPDMTEEMREIERTRLSRSPTVVGLISSPRRDHPKVPVWEQELSCGASGLAWLIAANAMGYDAQWLTEWIAFDPELAGMLGCREGERIAGFIHVGTRTMPKTERDRPAIDDVLSVLE